MLRQCHYRYQQNGMDSLSLPLPNVITITLKVNGNAVADAGGVGGGGGGVITPPWTCRDTENLCKVCVTGTDHPPPLECGWRHTGNVQVGGGVCLWMSSPPPSGNPVSAPVLRVPVMTHLREFLNCSCWHLIKILTKWCWKSWIHAQILTWWGLHDEAFLPTWSEGNGDDH